jgi:putative nucleotidyltransferase with HDIG domain
MRLGSGTTVRRWFWAAFTFAVLSVVLTNSMMPERLALQEGRKAPRDIKAQRDFVDRAATERLKAERIAEVAAVYDIDRRVASEIEKNIAAVFDKAAGLAGQGALPTQDRLDELRKSSGLAIPPQYGEAILRADPAGIREAKDAAIEASRRVLETGVYVDSFTISLAQVDFELSQLRLPEEHKAFASVVVKGFMRPNRFINEAETAARRKKAAESVSPVKVFKGDLIVGRDEVVTEEHMRLLKEAGMVGERQGMAHVLPAALVSLLVVCIMWTYLGRFRPEVYSSESKVMQTALILSGTVVLSRFLGAVSEYLAPVQGGTMLLATLLDPGTAILGAVCMSVAAGVAVGNDAAFMVVAALSSVTAVYGISRVGHRSDLIRAGALVGLVSGVSAFAMALVAGLPLGEGLRNVVLGVINGGVISPFLALGALPFFETLFNIMTPVKLLELANPNHPLLSRLLIEAPGTYHHSIMVANLAEAAAEAVGANSLLARVGGYYHDIGKTKRPYFFIENQLGVGENPHDKVAPGLSTLIVTSHVKDGIEMARSFRLPARVVDFIREHHGTTLVSYFYSRATEDEKTGCRLAEDDFRYEGPRPNSKETAIVMLADSVEAAVRSLIKPSPGRIEAIVRRIVKDRLYDHQLDKCDLTLRDLDTVSDTFMRVLSGMFHPRVGYPQTSGAAGTPSGEGTVTNGGTGGRSGGGASEQLDAGKAGGAGEEERGGDPERGGEIA